MVNFKRVSGYIEIFHFQILQRMFGIKVFDQSNVEDEIWIVDINLI